MRCAGPQVALAAAALAAFLPLATATGGSAAAQPTAALLRQSSRNGRGWVGDQVRGLGKQVGHLEDKVASWLSPRKPTPKPAPPGPRVPDNVADAKAALDEDPLSQDLIGKLAYECQAVRNEAFMRFHHKPCAYEGYKSFDDFVGSQRICLKMDRRHASSLNELREEYKSWCGSYP
eukprot:gnl/TRDRNA2_/TRDRNA2_178684_c0_seq1.p2 gnl/TRDRNA2_/TRDRNA2_178684_c0~~gnl/TRDRNA2_/TRDRNA2_178684_c0_seq1.p2  ORF type:complete len:176 (+),score=35.88 gnl/TRDRNA2_/TRDRNA2_178684_c0_seq1:89-616(+)